MSRPLRVPAGDMIEYTVDFGRILCCTLLVFGTAYGVKVHSTMEADLDTVMREIMRRECRRQFWKFIGAA